VTEDGNFPDSVFVLNVRKVNFNSSNGAYLGNFGVGVAVEVLKGVG